MHVSAYKGVTLYIYIIILYIYIPPAYLEVFFFVVFAAENINFIVPLFV